MSKYNLRYLLYCKENGKNPREMLAHDRKKYPGGSMCNYILWIDQQWFAFAKVKGLSRHDPRLAFDQKGFDEWLESKIEEQK